MIGRQRGVNAWMDSGCYDFDGSWVIWEGENPAQLGLVSLLTFPRYGFASYVLGNGIKALQHSVRGHLHSIGSSVG